MKEFNLLVRGERYWTVEKRNGYEVHNQDGLTLYTHKDTTGWHIIEKETGLFVIGYYATKKDAKKAVEGLLKVATTEHILKSVQSRLKGIQTNLQYVAQ